MDMEYNKRRVFACFYGDSSCRYIGLWIYLTKGLANGSSSYLYIYRYVCGYYQAVVVSMSTSVLVEMNISAFVVHVICVSCYIRPLFFFRGW